MTDDAKAIAERLTQAQGDCLIALGMYGNIGPYEPSAADLSRMAGKPRYWAHDRLQSLWREQLARRTKCPSGSVTWRITDLGCAVAEALRERETP